MLGIKNRLGSLTERSALTIGCFTGSAIDWLKVNRVVFVCTGNICRSPFAEALARVQGLAALSCGTDTRSGFPAEPMAITEAAHRGIDLSSHRTTRWPEMELKPGDIVIATQLKHALAARELARKAGTPIVLMSSLLPEFQVVRDPYGREAKAFVTAFDQIERAVSRIQSLSRAQSAPT